MLVCVRETIVSAYCYLILNWYKLKMFTRCLLFAGSASGKRTSALRTDYLSRYQVSSHKVEIWKDIDGFSRYQVSSHGNVKNIKLGKLLNINYDRFKKINANPQVNLTSDSGKRRALTVSRLILNCFDPNPDAKGYLQFTLTEAHRITNYPISNGIIEVTYTVQKELELKSSWNQQNQEK